MESIKKVIDFMPQMLEHQKTTTDFLPQILEQQKTMAETLKLMQENITYMQNQDYLRREQAEPAQAQPAQAQPAQAQTSQDLNLALQAILAVASRASVPAPPASSAPVASKGGSRRRNKEPRSRSPGEKLTPSEAAFMRTVEREAGDGKLSEEQDRRQPERDSDPRGREQSRGRSRDRSQGREQRRDDDKEDPWKLDEFLQK